MDHRIPHLLPTGLLISLEGIDGCGKSSLAQGLAERLSSEYQTLLTKQPGGTALGAQLRSLLNYPEAPVSPRAEYLMFAADRAQHFYEVVLPHLAQGTIVISDRMGDSSMAYQGYARGLDHQIIATVNAWAMQERKPDMVFYLKIDPAIAFERIAQRNEKLTSFEKEKKEFMQKASQGFDIIFHEDPRVITLDARQSPQALVTQAHAAVLTYLSSTRNVA